MKTFRSVCLITDDVARLRDFYARVLVLPAQGDDTFASFATEGAGLSLFSFEGLEQMTSDAASRGGAGSCFLEFEVTDVDKEYEQLLALGVEIIKAPTTQPWGIRAVWFRDPDGNPVNFFARVA